MAHVEADLNAVILGNEDLIAAGRAIKRQEDSIVDDVKHKKEEVGGKKTLMEEALFDTVPETNRKTFEFNAKSIRVPRSGWSNSFSGTKDGRSNCIVHRTSFHLSQTEESQIDSKRTMSVLSRLYHTLYNNISITTLSSRLTARCDFPEHHLVINQRGGGPLTGLCRPAGLGL